MKPLKQGKAVQEQFSLESGKYHLSVDVPAIADRGPIKAKATVRIDSNKVSVDVARPAVKLVGRIGEDGKLRLGTTTLERSLVVSNHYIGDVKEGTASGKVHFFGNGEKAFTGIWKLESKKSVE